jgi:hypothetical protein
MLEASGEATLRGFPQLVLLGRFYRRGNFVLAFAA